MKIKRILIAAIAPFLTLITHFHSAATAQQLSTCDVRVVGEERGSRVNLRTGAGSNFESTDYVLVGQYVNMLDTESGRRISRQDRRGAIWYFVEYTPSRTRGWIREDFIAPQCS